MHPAEAYAGIRGFNLQPDWGASGIAVWLRFDAARYRTLLRAGKAAFPGINALRVWLSFDAWCEGRAAYLASLRMASAILTEEGLAFMPVYFNGWYGIPHFGAIGGSVLGHLEKRDWEPYRSYLIDSMEAVRTGNVLLHDLCNEPYNNLLRVREAVDRMTRFLAAMAAQARQLDTRPLTVGSQGMYLDSDKTYHDFDALAPFADVLSAHPYMATDAHVDGLLARAAAYEKPLIVTECVWGAADDEGHVQNMEAELSVLTGRGLGFLAHALCTSPVADLHPVQGKDALTCLGLYMAFLDGDLHVRPGHEAFNRYCP